MILSDDIIKSLECCLNRHNHIVEEAVLLECGGNACEKCINYANKSLIKCNYCNNEHQLSHVAGKMQANPIIKTLIKTYLNDLFEMLRSNYDEIVQSIESNIYSFIY